MFHTDYFQSPTTSPFEMFKWRFYSFKSLRCFCRRGNVTQVTFNVWFAETILSAKRCQLRSFLPQTPWSHPPLTKAFKSIPDHFPEKIFYYGFRFYLVQLYCWLQIPLATHVHYRLDNSELTSVIYLWKFYLGEIKKLFTNGAWCTLRSYTNTPWK